MTRLLSGDAKTSFNLSFSLPLGNRTNASINTSAQPGREQTSLQVSRSVPAGSGLGYRLAAGVGDSDRRAAEVSAQNGIGAYNLAVDQFQGQVAFRGSAAVAWRFSGVAPS